MIKQRIIQNSFFSFILPGSNKFLQAFFITPDEAFIFDGDDFIGAFSGLNSNDWGFVGMLDQEFSLRIAMSTSFPSIQIKMLKAYEAHKMIGVTQMSFALQQELVPNIRN